MAKIPELAKLKEFETAVYSRKRVDRLAENQAALQALLQCLRAMREGAWAEGFANFSMDQVNRMVSAILALFLDPGFKLTQEGFDLLAAERAVIECLFQTSGFGGSDFVFSLVPEDAEGVNKYLLLFSVDSELPLDLEQIFRDSPQETLGLYLSLLGHGQVMTPRADAMREKLLTYAPYFEQTTLSANLYNALCGAYMHCSYAHSKDKHAPKRMLHKMVRQTLEANIPGGLPHFGPPVRKEKPTIVVILEWWNSKHAMFRTYAKSIQQLRQRFHIIGMRPGTESDQAARDVFDEWVEIDADPLSLPDMAKRVIDMNPDIVYYPSIGMAVWAIAMASLRLAPIQVMTYGHPATSNSPEIDYGIIEEDFFDPAAGCFAEEIITIPSNTLRQTPYELVPTRHTPRRTEVIKIGVSAMQVKVTRPFIEALRAAQVKANKQIEVTFFSCASGVGLYSMADLLSTEVANVSVQEKQDYANYMKSLAECDICLFSFPFGGWNSTIDAMLLGLPMVSMFDNEPHARSDAVLMGRAGLPAELVTTTPAEYTDAIVRLFDDDYRAEVAAAVRAVDVNKLLFEEGAENTSFVDAFTTIYDANLLEAAA